MAEFNEAFSKVLEFMEGTSKNLFITGRAGTGKSTLLNHFKGISKKSLAVIAPTGVAAVNVEGQTIHSFFGFKPNITLDNVKVAKNRRMFQALDTLIIDEISMVRADLLDCVDKFLKINRGNTKTPFGGIQMILFGDFFQLPPIVSNNERTHFSTFYKSPYFFDSNAFQELEFKLIELDEVFRQKDKEFVNMLDGVRHNKISNEHIAKLNERVKPYFKPLENELYIRLCTLNKMADEINALELEKINAPIYCFRGAIEGEFSPEYLPCEQKLNIKTGAQVMFLNNDSAKRWVNGTMGKVTGFHKTDENYGIQVELTTKEKVTVKPHTWELFKPKHDALNNTLAYETIGTFTQYPLRLAWAITIHKSQGKTFEKAIIDFGEGTFAPGQAYVALSRCTTLEGMVLKKPLEKRHVMADEKIVGFMEKAKREQNGMIPPDRGKIVKP